MSLIQNVWNSKSNWDLICKEKHQKQNIGVKHSAFFLSSTINTNLFKTMGRRVSPNQLQLRLRCNVLSNLGWKCCCGRNRSTTIRSTKCFLFSPWKALLLLPYIHSNYLAIDQFTWKLVFATQELMLLHLHFVWFLITVG